MRYCSYICITYVLVSWSLAVYRMRSHSCIHLFNKHSLKADYLAGLCQVLGYTREWETWSLPDDAYSASIRSFIRLSFLRLTNIYRASITNTFDPGAGLQESKVERNCYATFWKEISKINYIICPVLMRVVKKNKTGDTVIFNPKLTFLISFWWD